MQLSILLFIVHRFVSVSPNPTFLASLNCGLRMQMENCNSFTRRTCFASSDALCRLDLQVFSLFFSFLFFSPLPFFSFIYLPCPGSTRDHLVLTSDSGSITVAEWRSHHWETVHNETFGRSECRRVVAGEYLAADPKGRAVLVGRSHHRTLLLLLFCCCCCWWWWWWWWW